MNCRSEESTSPDTWRICLTYISFNSDLFPPRHLVVEHELALEAVVAVGLAPDRRPVVQGGGRQPAGALMPLAAQAGRRRRHAGGVEGREGRGARRRGAALVAAGARVARAGVLRRRRKLPVLNYKYG